MSEFFYDNSALSALRAQVIEPLVRAAKGAERLRVWVAGSSTGEEAYTLAILFLETIRAAQASCMLQMFATGSNESQLATARAGFYPASIEQAVCPQRLRQLFTKVCPGRYRVQYQLRDLIAFASHNITVDPPFSRMDLISCRSVLSSLPPQARKDVLNVLHFGLRPGGYLFTGEADLVNPAEEQFTPLAPSAGLYQKLGVTSRLPVMRVRRSMGRANPRRIPKPAPDSREDADMVAMRRAVMQAVLAPTMVVDGAGKVLFLHGDLRPYAGFPEGEPHLEVDTILNPELRARVRSALVKCRREKAKVSVISPATKDRPRCRISARLAPEVGDDVVVVCFEPESELQVEITVAASSTEQDAVVEELERELWATREDLRHAVDELESSNEQLRASSEEAMSMNEELQSTNEELEASTEELRSLNDELSALNSELREKVEALQHSNDDLANFFTSAEIAIIFLDEELKLRRFTPAAAKVLGLNEDALGRPVAQLKGALLEHGLTADCRAVLNSLTSVSRELESQDERWLVRRVLPYRTKPGHIAGVVVAFIDVTELKSATLRLERREQRQALVARLGMSVLRATNLGELLIRICHELQQALAMDLVGVFQLDAHDHHLVLEVGAGWPEGYAGHDVLGADPASPAGTALAAGKVVTFEHLAEGRRFSASPLLSGLGVVSGACCPIQLEDEAHIFGVLGVYHREVRELSRDDQYFLQAIANIIGNAIRRHRVATRVALERNVARILSTAHDLHEAGPAILQVLGQQLESSTCEMWVPAESGDAIVRVHTVDVGERTTSRHVQEAAPARLNRGEGLVGGAWEKGCTQWSTLMSRGDGYVRSGTGGDPSVLSGLAFPVTTGTTSVAVVAAYFARRLLPDPALIRVLDGLGRALGEFVRRTEAESEQARLAALVSSSSDAILSKDLSGIIRSWNAAAEELYGYTAEEVIGRSVEIIYPEDLREELNQIIQWIARGEQVSHYETVRRRKDGTLVDISITVSPIVIGGGKIIGGSAISRDISERKRTEAMLREADRQKDQFLAMLGHELRNPLAAISTAAELMKRSCLGSSPQAGRAREIIERQSAHMARLLDGLLDVSRMVSGKTVLEREVLDLVHLLRNVLGDRERPLQERGIQLHVDLPPGPVWVWGDCVRLVQIFDNLVSNAIKFTPPQGRLGVAARVEGKRVIIMVEDSGAGIDEGLLPHIFEPFRQAEQSLARASGGLGLGLALVKGLVELHGGKVVASSDGPNRGTTFSVALPLSEHLPEREARQAPEGKSARVLVVEDDRDTADALKEILILEGYQAEVAYTGEAAVNAAQRLRPHLVLCDIGLPGEMTGYEVAGTLRQLPELQGAYLVALTGYGSPEDVSRATQAGFDAHIIKPIELDTLTKLLATLRPASGGEGSRA